MQAVISDKKIPVPDAQDPTIVAFYNPGIITATDYYPFGMVMPNRSVDTDEYRYGFNGKENDNEVKGTGNQQDYGFRVYDARIAKFLSVDPLTKDYPWYTPYQFAGNKPIWASDLDGREEFIRTDYFNSAGQLYRTVIQVVEEGELSVGILIHVNSVFVDIQGNAEGRYEGSMYSPDPNTNLGVFFGSMTNLMSNRTTVIPNLRDREGRTSVPGELVRYIRVDRDAIVTGLEFVYSVVNNDNQTTVKPMDDGMPSPITNANISVPDPSHNGTLVVEPNSAIVPQNEPYLPAGFHTTPPINQRFNIEGGGALTNPGRELTYDASLSDQSYSAVGRNTVNKSAASSVNTTRIQNNLPTLRQVGAGNASLVLGFLMLRVLSNN